MGEAKRATSKAGVLSRKVAEWMMRVSYWLLWLFYGRGKSVVRGLIWKEETRAEKPSEVIWGGVWRYKGASKRWGLCERAMERLGGWDAYLAREDGARAKK